MALNEPTTFAGETAPGSCDSGARRPASHDLRGRDSGAQDPGARDLGRRDAGAQAGAQARAQASALGWSPTQSPPPSRNPVKPAAPPRGATERATAATGASRNPATQHNISISLESYESVRPLLEKFAGGRVVHFFVAVFNGQGFNIRCTHDDDVTELPERGRVATGGLEVVFSACNAERDPRAEDVIARYLSLAPFGARRVTAVYKRVKTATEEKIAAYLVIEELRQGAPQVAPSDIFRINSFFDAVLYVCLHYCAVSRRGDNFFGMTPDLLARAAGQLFLQTVTQLATGRANYAFYEVCCDIASAQYEGRSHAGYIVLASSKSDRIKPIIRFRRPIHISHATGARKLVEMASKDFALLFDGDYFFGFADYKESPDIHHIRFSGRGVWSMNHGSEMLGLISYGTPVEIDRILTKTAFLNHLKRQLPTITTEGLERIWEIATVACEQAVGTNILFTPAASKEAARLSSACIPIAPVALTPDVTNQLTSIDGTLIADIEGYVHAVGAIMDGACTVNGTWQRGGRYNSAANYVSSAKHPAVIFIVSQDGYVDIVPPIDAQGSKWTMRRYLKLSSTAT